jgi:hypothetical protein
LLIDFSYYLFLGGFRLNQRNPPKGCARADHNRQGR